MTDKKLPLEAYNEQNKWFTSGELARIGKEKAENAACYPDYVDMDIPTTAKGIRVRLESVTILNPQLRKKNTNKRGDLYHIDAFKIILNSDEKEMIKQNTQSIENTDLNLLLEIYRSLPADKRKALLKVALTMKKNDLG